jgi:hypothetical protein
MIEILSQSTESCLCFRLSGKVTGEDYQKFLTTLGEHIKTSGEVNLVMELSDFESYGDFEAAKEDFKFVFGDYKRIHRAAFVGDQKFIEWVIRLMDPFTRTEEKQFPEGQTASAQIWASS